MIEPPKFIIELDRDEIEFLAAVAHLAKFTLPDNPVPKKLIASLIQQTEFVSSDPHNHGLNFTLRTPLTSQQKWGVLVSDFDLSYIQQMNLDA